MKKYLFSLIAFTVALAACVFFDGLELLPAASVAMAFPLAVVGPDRERAFYDYFRDRFPFFGIEKGVVRLEQAVTTQSILKFDPRQVSINQNLYPLSKGVDDNDVDIVLRTGLFCDIRPNTTPQLPVVLQTYPNAQAFADLTTVSNVEAFYNGVLGYKVGQTLVNQGLDTQIFRKVPQTQQTTATNYSQGSIAENCIDVNPAFVISGKADNLFTLDLNVPAAWTVDPNTSTNSFYVTLYHQTLKIKNAANVFYELLYLATGQSGAGGNFAGASEADIIAQIMRKA